MKMLGPIALVLCFGFVGCKSAHSGSESETAGINPTEDLINVVEFYKVSPELNKAFQRNFGRDVCFGKIKYRLHRSAWDSVQPTDEFAKVVWVKRDLLPCSTPLRQYSFGQYPNEDNKIVVTILREGQYSEDLSTVTLTELCSKPSNACRLDYEKVNDFMLDRPSLKITPADH